MYHYSSLGITFLACVTFAAAGLPFQDCGGVYEIKDLNVNDCELPCDVKIGSTLNVTVKLLADKAMSIKQNDVLYEIEGVNVTPQLNSDCASKGCIINAGEYIFQNSALVDYGLPEGEMILQWKLINQDEITIFCFKTFPFYFIN